MVERKKNEWFEVATRSAQEPEFKGGPCRLYRKGDRVIFRMPRDTDAAPIFDIDELREALAEFRSLPPDFEGLI